MTLTRFMVLVFALVASITASAQSTKCIHEGCLALTIEEALSFRENTRLHRTENVSSVNLQPRFIDPSGQLNPQLNPDVKVLIAPDGMDNLGYYIDPESRFNLYNFTHWSQIDILSWFGGTANKTLLIPSRPWVEAAHKNGVKVIGSIFLAISQWGGSADTVSAFLQRDENGHFPMAHRLVEIAEYYGFDGWLMNQETDLSAVKNELNELVTGLKDYNRSAFLGKEMLAFMQYLTHIAPEGMEIHWYDAQILDGTVQWQNELNDNNAMFFGSAKAPAADAIFLNYWWDREMILSSRTMSKELGRDPYDVYTGADLWPQRTAQVVFKQTQWLDDIFSDKEQQGLTSIALFANNVNFSFLGDEHTPAYSTYKSNKKDFQRFFDTETRLFAGDDLNMASNQSDGWNGLSRYIPARSVITTLPFSSFFNVGQGLKRALHGNIVDSTEWHNIGEQDLLPSWQFAIVGNSNTSVRFDFDNPYHGGSSLLVQGTLEKDSIEIPLFKTSIDEQAKTLTVVFKSHKQNVGAIQLRYSDGSSHSYSLEGSASNQWKSISFNLSNDQTASLQRISYKNEEHHSGEFSLNIGALMLE